jgi:acetylornithine/succinyldiaminopimelate/putrescine aminotransferase
VTGPRRAPAGHGPGEGRVLSVLACEHYGLAPDLVILSKALGGGIAKLAALFVRAERWRPELSVRHTSTFADDDFSAAVALGVLDLLTDEALTECAEKGRWLKERLGGLAADYPDVLRGVRGLGLMLGVEFVEPRDQRPKGQRTRLALREFLQLTPGGRIRGHDALHHVGQAECAIGLGRDVADRAGPRPVHATVILCPGRSDNLKAP